MRAAMVNCVAFFPDTLPLCLSLRLCKATEKSYAKSLSRCATVLLYESDARRKRCTLAGREDQQDGGVVPSRRPPGGLLPIPRERSLTTGGADFAGASWRRACGGGLERPRRPRGSMEGRPTRARAVGRARSTEWHSAGRVRRGRDAQYPSGIDQRQDGPTRGGIGRHEPAAQGHAGQHSPGRS